MRKIQLFLIIVSASCLTVNAYADTDSNGSIVTDEEALFGSVSGGADGTDGSVSNPGGASAIAGDKTVAADGSAVQDTASLEDELFGGDEAGIFSTDSPGESSGNDASLFIQEATSSGGFTTELLVSENVEIGGSYGFTATGGWIWDEPEEFFDNLTDPSSDSAEIELGTTIFFDARPDENFRVFGKTTISHPFAADETRDFSDVFHIDELFSDFNWNNTLFFRGGKHTINWGVGYFFSPADLLNITEIDPEDPEAEREGPVSLKIQYPFGLHNAYLYGIANSIETPDEYGIAGKLEFVIGGMEMGVGGLYQKDIAPSAMITASVPFEDIDFFGEAVFRNGSDRTFIEESDDPFLGVKAVTYDNTLFFNATVGFSFFYTFDADDSSVSFAGQYLYNGEGYDDPSLISDNTMGVGALLAAGEIAYSDLMNTGKHYSALSGNWNDIFGSDFSMNALWIHNYSDSSGWLSPSLGVELFDGLSISLRTPYLYGEKGGEYTQTGDSFSLQLSANLGGGRY